MATLSALKFGTLDGAVQALTTLQGLQKQQLIQIQDAAIVTWPVNVWFNGSKSFAATLDFGGRAIRKITLDPFGRFPDKDVTDNIWPR